MPSEQQLCSRRGVSIMLALALSFAHTRLSLHHHKLKAVGTKHNLYVSASIFAFLTAERHDAALHPIHRFIRVHLSVDWKE